MSEAGLRAGREKLLMSEAGLRAGRARPLMPEAGLRTGRALQAVGCCLCVCVVLCYAALLPRARWQGDEYYAIALMRDMGWQFHRYFFLHWSPRAVSNILYAFYGAMVNAVRRPLSGTYLALLWAGIGGACIAPALLRGRVRLPRLLLGLFIWALCLVGHGVTEVFFWPGGGTSYIPTLAGTIWVFWYLADGMPARAWRRTGAAAALAVVGGSSEVGLFLTLCACACLVTWHARRGLGALWWLLPGFSLAVLDLLLLIFGRLGTAETAGVGQTLMHHAGASVLAALPAFASALVVPDTAAPGWRPALLSLLARVAIFAAARWVLPAEPTSGRRDPLLLFAASLLLASLATLAAAYYQFGALCCERHDTMRACFITLAIICAGLWSADALPVRGVRPAAGGVAACAAVLLLFVPSLPGIAADFRSLPGVIAARAQTWASGRADGSDMIFLPEPAGKIVSGPGFQPGVFILAKDTPWFDSYLLVFFHKTKVTIVSPRP